jgi:hypothetical protein
MSPPKCAPISPWTFKTHQNDIQQASNATKQTPGKHHIYIYIYIYIYQIPTNTWKYLHIPTIYPRRHKLTYLYIIPGQLGEPRRLQKSPGEPRRIGEPRRPEKSPGEPRRAQETPEEARRAQESPGEPKRHQKRPGEARRGQESPRDPRRL